MQNQATPTQDRILRLPDVMSKVGLSKNSIARLIKRSEFPAAVQLSPYTVGWRESEIARWIKTRRPAKEHSHEA
jgi:prophage regulatory protein